MFSMNNISSASALSFIDLSVVVEPNGPIFNGPGAAKPYAPFRLRNLGAPELASIEKAKKYAMEQSIRAVLLRQTQMQQSQQLNNIKKQQTIALLNRVYVGSIAYDVREDSLRQSFMAFGPIKSIAMSWDAATQKHKGFAFLEYEYPEAAQLSIDQMNTASFGGRQLKVGRPSNLANADTMISDLVTEYKLQSTIYVAGIHRDLTADDITLVFGAFGKIVHCKLQPDPVDQCRHRGFGYIEFQTTDSATDAVTSMNLFNLGGQLLRVCKAISPPDGLGITSTTAGSGLPPAAAVAAASATAKILSMETEQMPINNPNPIDYSSERGFNSFPSSEQPFEPPVESESPPSTVYDYFHGSLEHKSTAQPLGSWEAVDDLETAAFRKLPSSNPPLPAATAVCSVDSGYDDQNGLLSSTESMPAVLILRNMVDPKDCDDELEHEIAGECSNHGAVQRVLIHQQVGSQTNTVVVKVFVQYDSPQSVEKAVAALDGRYFAGRQIVAESYDSKAFITGDFTG